MQYLMDVWIVEVELKSLHLIDLGCWISADVAGYLRTLLALELATYISWRTCSLVAQKKTTSVKHELRTVN